MNVRRSTSGFSLIELLIAMAIGLAILAVLGTVFSRTSSGRSDLERVTRLVENSRFAAEVIGEDLRHAGFYGALMPPSDVVYDSPSPCVNPVDAVALGWRPNDSPPHYPAPLQGWNDPAAGIGDLDCLDRRVERTDVLVIRRVSSEPTDAAGVNTAPFTARNFFVQPSQCVSDPAVVRISDTAASLDLRTAACTAALAPARRYFTRAYYVASCNDCGTNSGAGDGIPTLKRVEYLNGAYRETALAEGVENLQFEYAIDDAPAAPAAPDGVPDSLVTSTANWANVVGVRMHLLMRSSEPGLTVDTTPTIFNLGPGHDGVNAVPCPDRFRCRLLTSTFRLNNVAGRREK